MRRCTTLGFLRRCIQPCLTALRSGVAPTIIQSATYIMPHTLCQLTNLYRYISHAHLCIDVLTTKTLLFLSFATVTCFSTPCNLFEVIAVYVLLYRHSRQLPPFMTTGGRVMVALGIEDLCPCIVFYTQHLVKCTDILFGDAAGVLAPMEYHLWAVSPTGINFVP
jgi:hypothetical protein